MYNDPEFSRAKFQGVMGRLWARRATAPAHELPAIDGELWRLLQVFVNPGQPPARRPSPYHGPTSESPGEVELWSRESVHDACRRTTRLVLRRGGSARYRLEVRVSRDDDSECVYRSRPFRSGRRLAEELVRVTSSREFGFGERHRDGPIDALLPAVALLSRRLADDTAIALVTSPPGVSGR